MSVELKIFDSDFGKKAGVISIENSKRNSNAKSFRILEHPINIDESSYSFCFDWLNNYQPTFTLSEQDLLNLSQCINSLLYKNKE